MILVVGGPFAAQARDPLGLAGYLRLELIEARKRQEERREQEGKDWRHWLPSVQVVCDLTNPHNDGTSRGLVRAISDLAVAGRLSSDMRVVSVVGIEDSRAGGPPPTTFVANLEHAAQIADSCLAQLYLVIPTAPPEFPGPTQRGYARGSLRWLRRIHERLAEYKPLHGPPHGLILALVSMEDAHWSSPLGLRSEGIRRVASVVQQMFPDAG